MGKGHPLTLILLYHRVVDRETDPQLLCVSPRHFQHHLEVMSLFGPVRTIEDALDDPMAHQIAITFDDGYADNVHVAAPILATAQTPATIFVTSGNVATKELFWWDELEHLVLLNSTATSKLTISVGGRSLYADVRTSAAKRSFYAHLQERLRLLPLEEIGAVLSQLRASLGEIHRPQFSDRPVSLQELQHLAANPLITLGSHTLSHPWLSSLSRKHQLEELKGSKRQLHQWTGRAIPGIAFPFGYGGAYSKTTMKLARSSGYTYACSNHQGNAAVSSRWSLPRYLVRDWDGASFREQLSSWFAEAAN